MQIGLALTNNITKTSIKKYRKIQVQWEHIPRANCSKGKLISEKSIKILSDIWYKLQKQGNVIYNHKYLSKLTKCKHDQNTNLLKQLRLVFNIEYYKFKIIEGKIYQNIHLIRPHENTFEILNNTKNYFAKKLSVTSEKTGDLTSEKNVNNAEFSRPVYITKEISKRYRSMKSNFIKNNFKDKPKKQMNFFNKPKKLTDFYPLSAEDGSKLQTTSGREFSLHAMNEILKSLGNKLNNHLFNSKKSFMSYMAKVFKYEMRDAVKIDNETFRITANLTEEDKKAMVVEKYLTEVENTKQVSPAWHLKKKLANVLKPETAYNLLRNFIDINVRYEVAEITLKEHVELTETDKNLVLEQVKATHERVDSCGIFTPIKTIKYNMLARPAVVTASTTYIAPRTGIWGNIRSKIAELLGKDGDVIDTNLFSRLDAEINEQTKQIKLKAFNNHLKTTIEDRYKYTIYEAAESCGFKIKEIYC